MRLIKINSKSCVPGWIKLGDEGVASLHSQKMVGDKRCRRAVTFCVNLGNGPTKGTDQSTSFKINDAVIQAFITTNKAYVMLDLKPIIICAFGCGRISLAYSVVCDIRECHTKAEYEECGAGICRTNLI